MLWWNQIRSLLKAELQDAEAAAQPDPAAAVQQGESLLKKSARELAAASAKCDAAAIRVQRVRESLDRLAEPQTSAAAHALQIHELSAALAHEMEMHTAFCAHRDQLSMIHSRIQLVQQKLERDAQMLRAVRATKYTALAINEPVQPSRSEAVLRGKTAAGKLAPEKSASEKLASGSERHAVRLNPKAIAALHELPNADAESVPARASKRRQKP